MLKIWLTYLFAVIGTCDADRIYIECGSNNEVKPAFHASMVRQPYTFSDPYEILKFEHVWTNIGNGYNPDTGIFIVPRTGLYQVMGTLWSTGDKRCAASLFKNDTLINHGWTKDMDADSSTVHAILVLNKEDRIYFQNRGSTDYQCYGYYHSAFSGFFIHE